MHWPTVEVLKYCKDILCFLFEGKGKCGGVEETEIDTDYCTVLMRGSY